MVTQWSCGDVEFRFFRPEAQGVSLVGDFNGWDYHAHPMTKTKGGTWVAQLSLPQGVYQFRYLADGQWYVDYAAFGVELCPYGHNSVVLVGDKAGEPATYLG